MEGATSAKKLFKFVGRFSVVDETNQVTATVTFLDNPVKKSTGLLSGLFGKKEAEVPPQESELNRVLVQISKDGAAVSEGRGSYTSYLEFDGKVLWRHFDHHEAFDFSSEALAHPLAEDTLALKQLLAQKKYKEAAPYDRLTQAAQRYQEEERAALSSAARTGSCLYVQLSRLHP